MADSGSNKNNGGAKIDRVVRGEEPTLLHTDKANELIDTVNALQDIRISPSDAGSVEYSATNVMITLKGTVTDATPIACQGNFEGTYTTKYLLEVPAPE